MCYQMYEPITIITVICFADVRSEPSENGEKDEFIVPSMPSDIEVQRQFYDYMVHNVYYYVKHSYLLAY